MTKQRKHVRKSSKGKKFLAGKSRDKLLAELERIHFTQKNYFYME